MWGLERSTAIGYCVLYKEAGRKVVEVTGTQNVPLLGRGRSHTRGCANRKVFIGIRTKNPLIVEIGDSLGRGRSNSKDGVRTG